MIAEEIESGVTKFSLDEERPSGAYFLLTLLALPG